MLCPTFSHKAGVYQIRNTETGKRYVGSSVYLQKRWWTHLRDLNLGTHHCEHLQRSWKKRGGEGFVFEPLLYCLPAQAVWYEQQLIDALLPEFNTCQTAGSCLGIKLTAEHKAKIGNAHRGMKRTEQTKANISKGQKGRKLSAEQIQKMKEWAARPENSRARKPLSAEHREAIRQGSLRKVMTPEHLAKLEQARRRPASDEKKAKISQALRGRNAKVTEDQVREIRKARVDKVPFKTLVLRYGISQASLSDIVHRRSYGYVPDEI